jgi:hypothetical protein
MPAHEISVNSAPNGFCRIEVTVTRGGEYGALQLIERSLPALRAMARVALPAMSSTEQTVA